MLFEFGDMHGLFGFDPTSLSDEELLERVTELNRRIMYAAKFMSGDIIYALQQQRAACEFEQRERMIAPGLRSRADRPPVVVETDPDLAAAYKAEVEAEAARNAPKSHPRQKPFSPMSRERIRPTNRPNGDQ